MVDVEYLGRLVALLSKSNVTSYKTAGLELTFSPGLTPTEQKSETSPPPAFETQSVQIPVDLRTDSANSFDKLLHWSGSPAPDEPETPGIDDLPLTLASPSV